MDSWKELSLTKKILIGTVIIVAASFAPELMILVDVGGIDLAFGFLLVYFKPAIDWLQCMFHAVVEELRNVRHIILNSALAKTKVLTFNTIYCTVFLLVTGSTVLSISLLMPALLLNGNAT